VAHTDDLALIFDARIDGRHRHHAVVEYRRKPATDIALCEIAKSARRIGLQREVDGGPIEFIGGRARIAQVAACHGRDSLNSIDDRVRRLD
jgi:hypothetical protein